MRIVVIFACAIAFGYFSALALAEEADDEGYQPPRYTSGIPPIPPIPPIGTSDCRMVQIQDANGNWVWRAICE